MRWNKIIILLLLSAFCFTTAAQVKDSTNVQTTKVEIVKDPKASEIINKYVAAIGGKEKMFDVKDRTTILNSTIQGIKIKMVIYQKAPNKLKQKMSFGEMEQVTYFDGNKAFTTFNGATQEVTGQQLEALQREADMNFLPDFDNKNVGTKYLGLEDVDGQKAHKIEFTSMSGDKWFEFFNDSSYLKVKEIKELITPQGNFQQEVILSDYRDINGLKFPFTIQQKVAGQDLVFNITNIELNKNLSDSLFIMKEEEGK
ncbi:MAG TPA: hypothetical protein VFF33_12555 [Ignavibacteriaceae bacterium]|nr:hypothetical protein [Ignavibacteriaceae bacterium]